MRCSTVGDLTLANLLSSASIWSTFICLHLVIVQFSTLLCIDKDECRGVNGLTVLNGDIWRLQGIQRINDSLQEDSAGQDIE